MAFKAGAETNNPTTIALSEEQNNTSSKSLKTANDADGAKKRKSSQGKEKRGRAKTTGGIDMKTGKSSSPRRQSSEESWMLFKEKSETNLIKSSNDDDQEEEDGSEPRKRRSSSLSAEKRKRSATEVQKIQEGRKRMLVYGRPSETYMKLIKEGSNVKNAKPKEDANTKPSEIPKLKQLAKLRSKCKATPKTAASSPPQTAATELATTKGPYPKQAAKETEPNRFDIKSQEPKPKKDAKLEDKIKQALKENFNSLVPMYETELKKITDSWVNTVYCSLTLRTNLVKLLYDAIPSINRSQFHMEDETILHALNRAKIYTRSEAENLIQFIKLLIGNRNRAKDEYTHMLTKIEIAESYNNNWKALTNKIKDLDEETKQLQLGLPQLLKTKEDFVKAAQDKIQKMETNISQREEDIKKLENQLCMLKQREHSYRGNISLKIEDYKDIKEEVLTLQTLEKEFEELKIKYRCQNEASEKRIKDLENQLEERKKTLKREKETKKQLKAFLIQLNSQQQHLYRKIGKDQVDFVLGRTHHEKTNKCDQLWLSAVKLVMKGFLVQMKRLERDKNKMLLELNSNNLDNYNNLATAIMQKDNFMKSIRQQMHAFNMASKYSTAKTSEVSIQEH